MDMLNPVLLQAVFDTSSHRGCGGEQIHFSPPQKKNSAGD